MKESSEKQEDYQKNRESGREVKLNVQMEMDEGASIQTEGMLALIGEEVKRGWDNMKHRKKCSRSPVCQEIQHRPGDTGEAPPSYVAMTMRIF